MEKFQTALRFMLSLGFFSFLKYKNNKKLVKFESEIVKKKKWFKNGRKNGDTVKPGTFLTKQFKQRDYMDTEYLKKPHSFKTICAQALPGISPHFFSVTSSCS